MKKSALAITLASLLSPVSYLQAQETSVDETIVVTANRFKQIDGAVLAQTVTVTKEDIRRQQADSLFDVFRTCLVLRLLNMVAVAKAHRFLFAVAVPPKCWFWLMVYVCLAQSWAVSISTNFQSTLLNVSTTFAAHAHLSMAQRRFPA